MPAWLREANYGRVGRNGADAFNAARFGNGIPFLMNCTRIDLDFSGAAGVPPKKDQ